MAYADLLEQEAVNSQYLVVMSPRRILTSAWTLVTGTIYSSSFEFGIVTQLTVEGEELTQASTSSVAVDEWYYDESTQLIYVNIGSDPSSSQVIATYEIYLGTFDAHWYRSPLDDSSSVVYYEPLIVRSPSIVSSASDVLFGFLPTFSSQISISNVTNFLQKHVYDSSFSRADIRLYHYLDNLELDNIKLVLTGFTSEISFSNQSINFSIQDATSFFNSQFRNSFGSSFYAPTDYPDVDPNFSGRPVRYSFGVVEGFTPVNVDYNIDAPTTSNNRKWVCIAGDSNLGSMQALVPASPSSTTTRTYLSSANGFRVGDTAWNFNQSFYFTITAVNKTGAHYIEHVAQSGAAATGDAILRSFVGNVTIIKNTVRYDLLYGRDYTTYVDAVNSVIGFQLVNNFEANFSIVTPLNPSDKVFCRVYGHKEVITIGGNPFGTNSAETGNTTNPIVILWHLLTTYLGLPESSLDTAAFIALEALVTEEVGFAVPASSSQDFPIFKNMILDICITSLLKFFLDSDMKWTLSQIGPMGANDYSIEDDELVDSSFDYNFSYQDLVSTVLVNYLLREVAEDGSIGRPLIALFDNTTTANLHLLNRQKSFDSLLFKSSDALTLATRLGYALGDRQGYLSIRTKYRFFDTLLNDVIEVSRNKMPGFEFEQETLRQRSFSVLSTSKSLTDISITLNDQKGIEDNSGDW